MNNDNNTINMLNIHKHLDLDKSKNISEFVPGIDTKHAPDTIHKLIEMIKKYGTFIRSDNEWIGAVHQYHFEVKYLNKIVPLTMIFDDTYQYIQMKYVRIIDPDILKCYLYLFLSINDEPTIKWIENDHSIYTLTYSDSKITLGGGEYLINFVHCLLSYIGYDRCRLDDDSYLVTKDSDGTETRCKLWLYLLLTKGKSWYHKFGYRPSSCTPIEYDIALSDLQKMSFEVISSHLTRVQRATNKDLLDERLIEAVNHLALLVENKEGLVSVYLAETKESDIIISLLNALFDSFFSKTYYLTEVNEWEQTQISFPWYKPYCQMLLANMLQSNNNIKESFYKLLPVA